MRTTASYRLVNLVRAKISTSYVTASDTDVAKALQVSRAAISAYKHGRDIMSPETLLRAQQLAELSEVEFMQLMLDMLLEGKPPDVDFLQECKEALRALKTTAASILLGTVLVLGLGSPTPTWASEGVLQGGTVNVRYIIRTRSRVLRWLQRLHRTLFGLLNLDRRSVIAPAF